MMTFKSPKKMGPIFTVMMLVALGTLFLNNGCAVNVHYDPSRPHHIPEGFRNDPPSPPHTGFLKWKWESMIEGLPKPPVNGYRFPVLPVDTGFLAENREVVTVTWIGHASLLLQMGGVNLITDPMFSERASPLGFVGPRRKVPPAMALDDLPRIDVVLVSHNHYDHLDLPSLKRLAAQPGGPPRIFVPLGLKSWLADEIFGSVDSPHVVEQDWWDASDYLGLRIHQVPAQHFSARTLWDTNEVLWGGFVVEHPAFRFYWAGDTGYAPLFKEIGRRFAPIDLAAVPIGAYEPRWFMKSVHVNPAEAVLIHQDVGARQTVGLHWGAFEMTDESMDEPPRKLAIALQARGIPTEEFFLMQHGETRTIQPDTGKLVVRRRNDSQQVSRREGR